MSKKKHPHEQPLHRQPPAIQHGKAKQGSRAETINLALAQATSPANRARARDHIEQCGSPVLAAKDIFLTYAEAAEQPDPRYSVACRAGCWFCCTVPVAVTAFEAAMVRSVVVTLPEEEQQAIWERLQEHVAAQNQALAESNGQPISFHRRCPLLTAEGICSVYDGRPLACRSVLSLDADRCRRALLEDDAGDPNIPYSLTNNAAISGVPQLMVTLNEGHLDHYPSYELASALYKLWTQPDSFLVWQQGERFAEDGFPRMAKGEEIYPTPAGLPIGPPK
jgi:Fe-S-cluster containining protein